MSVCVKPEICMLASDLVLVLNQAEISISGQGTCRHVKKSPEGKVMNKLLDDHHNQADFVMMIEGGKELALNLRWEEHKAINNLKDRTSYRAFIETS
ncbi:hypothetical protein P8452_38697 [Trifolium repens]|nr:hypothetical protein P8452_38697 [Trifolium repens]